MRDFSAEIHPQFSSVPDIQFAQAASELALRLGDFTVYSTGASKSEFPPEPSNLAALQLAYQETRDDDAIRIRRQFVCPIDSDRTLKSFSDNYAKIMGWCSESQSNDYQSHEFLEIAPRLSRVEGLRTVASFAVFRSIRDNRVFFGGLLIPKITVERGPLEVRNIFTSLMAQAGGKQELRDLFEEKGISQDKVSVDDVLRVQNGSLNAGAVLAAVHLPMVEHMTDIIKQLRAPAPLQGPNREQRRAEKRRR